jgi:signal transduction histidine kinase
MKPEMVFGFENAGWPALLVDKAVTVLRANQSALQAFGPQLLGGAKLSAIWSPENPLTAPAFLEKWERQPAASNVLKFNVRGINVSYMVVVCALKDAAEQFFVFQLFPDIGTGLGGAEGQAVEGTIQKQKLDVAIQLARSVALDFRNALGGVLGHSSLLLMNAEPEHPWRKSLVEIEKAVAKGAEAAASLGSFGRPTGEQQQKSPAAGSINAALHKTAEALDALATQRSARWEFQLERKLYSVRFDEAKIQQAFTKIIENALEAMPNGGVVRIATRNLDVSHPTQDRTAKILPGSYVCVEITDNGGGIEAAALPRIFEPFFTTKSAGKHRGLGLPWVYGVVTNLGGAVAVSSEQGAGASVRVYLPAEKSQFTQTDHIVKDLKGSETILFVDDEEIIVTLGQTVLSGFGYKVLTATSGQKAIELLGRPGSDVSLLVTDLVMPGMSGVELVEQAQKAFPRMRVLMMSGAVQSGDQTGKSYLPKPFTSQQLLGKVRSVLGVNTPPAA